MKKIILSAIFCLLQACMYAQNNPILINYQALLKDNNGNVINGNVNVTFKLYDSLVAGNLLWTETQNGLNSQNGIISTNLGVSTPFNQSHFNGGKCFLEIAVAGSGTMTPRLQFTSVPFAVRSMNQLKLLNYSFSARSWGDTVTYTLLDTVFSPGTCSEFLKLDVMGHSNSAFRVFVYWGPIGSAVLSGWMFVRGMVPQGSSVVSFTHTLNIPIKMLTQNVQQQVIVKVKNDVINDCSIENYFLFGQ